MPAFLHTKAVFSDFIKKRRRLNIFPDGYIGLIMKLNVLKDILRKHPGTLSRFVLPDGGVIPRHAHLTEVGHVVKKFIDCGGQTGAEEKALLQTHVGNDTKHRLRSDQFAKILELGGRILPNDHLDVEVEYDCCVVAQYPISEARPEGAYLDIILQRGRTQCRARERRKGATEGGCCETTAACC
jgi:Family of unknown function (DUF6428)